MKVVPFPKKGEFWEHYKGGVYTVIAVARDHETQALTVVYSDRYDNVWSLPLNEWMKILRDEVVGHKTKHLDVTPILYSGPRFFPWEREK